MSKKNISEIIVCPVCGREYFPAEIFIGRNLLGVPNDIDRNEEGKIISFNGSLMDLKEEYICDSCNKKFTVEAKIAFKCNTAQEDDFATEYISPLREKKISLLED